MIFSICFLLSLNVISPKIICSNSASPTSYIQGGLNESWIKEFENVTVLFVEGSYYQMGYQHGIFLKDDIYANFRAINHSLHHSNIPYEKIVEIADMMDQYVPFCYKTEMLGMADATGLSYNEIYILNIGLYIQVNFGCSSFAAWNYATKNNKLYHFRSHDLHLSDIKDPLTNRKFYETQILLIRNPDNAYASISPVTAGAITCADGFNDQHIGTGLLSSGSIDKTNSGLCVGFRVRMVLDFASTIQEAINFLTKNETIGYNFIVSDGIIPIGYAVETSAHTSYNGTWDHPNESVYPFWEIRDVVRRTNLYINETLALTQRSRFQPSYFPLISFLYSNLRSNDEKFCYAIPFKQYIALSKCIESKTGELTLNQSLMVGRDTYQGKTDFGFYLLQLFDIYQSYYQWVMCPETGDFIISFAENSFNAFEQDSHRFNFYDFLKT